jgi:hypothetical protein
MQCKECGFVLTNAHKYIYSNAMGVHEAAHITTKRMIFEGDLETILGSELSDSEKVSEISRIYNEFKSYEFGGWDND